METIIVICLLVVIVLLSRDKVVINKIHKKQSEETSVADEIPDIMGVPKPIKKSHTISNKATESQENKVTIEDNSFDPETEKKGFDIQIPQGELDNVFNEVPDFEEEEEEWHRYREPNGDDGFGFATGVTFEELSTVGALLQHDVLKPSQQQEAVNIVRKLQGTELFSLLENSMENASQKIAELLDKSFSTEIDSSSPNLRKNDLEDFDIGEFV